MENPILEVEDLRVYYKTVDGEFKAVDGVSFKVYRDEILGICGESGCGKSTLVEGLLRLVKLPGYIASGRVLYKSVDLVSLDEESLRKLRFREISYVPQGSMNSLNPVMRVEDQVLDVILEHTEISDEEAKKTVPRLFTDVALPPETPRLFPHELSGGMKQRVLIGASMSLSPNLIVADEPTTALDLTVQKVVLQSLMKIKEKLNATVIMIAHDMGVHAETADRLAVMYAGKIVEIGDVSAVFNDPLHPYVRALIETTPSLDRKTLKGIPGLAPSPLAWPPGCRFHPRCPFAMDICKLEEPTLQEMKDGRLVACHLLRRKA